MVCDSTNLGASAVKSINVKFLLVKAFLLLFMNNSSATTKSEIEIVSSTKDAAESEALEYIKNSNIIISKSVIHPIDLAGCLILSKKGKMDQYINILPSSHRNMLKPEIIKDKMYRDIVEYDVISEFQILKFFSISGSKNSIVEVIVNKNWLLNGPGLWSYDELFERAVKIGKSYVELGYNVKFNQNVEYSVMNVSFFIENKAEGRAGLNFIDSNGKVYTKTSRSYQKEIIGISPIDITDYLRKWQATKEMNREIGYIKNFSLYKEKGERYVATKGQLEELKLMKRLLSSQSVNDLLDIDEELEVVASIHHGKRARNH